jgi:putative tryptophan/tyrosine transport system substrate-binding protein
MRRRDFIKNLAAAIGVPALPAAAQESRIYRIGVLNNNPRRSPVVSAFFDELRRSGFVEGRNLIVESTGIGIPYPQFGDAAREIAKAKVEAFVVGGGSPPIHAVRAVAPGIPVVGVADDMVGDGLAQSLVRPGGSVTGVSILATELDGKRQEFLMELLPGVRQMTALADPRVQSPQKLQMLQDAARARGVELSIRKMTSAEAILPAIDAAKAEGAGGLNVLAASLFGGNAKMIIEHTTALRLPSIFMWPHYAEDGALIAYGPIQNEVYRQVARILAKVLRGADPATLPVEQPTTFELAINLETAKVINLTVPMNLLTRADRVV